MIDGFLTGFFLGFLLWIAVIGWYRSKVAKADQVWMDVVNEVTTKRKSKRRK